MQKYRQMYWKHLSQVQRWGSFRLLYHLWSDLVITGVIPIDLVVRKSEVGKKMGNQDLVLKRWQRTGRWKNAGLQSSSGTWGPRWGGWILLNSATGSSNHTSTGQGGPCAQIVCIVQASLTIWNTPSLHMRSGHPGEDWYRKLVYFLC